MSSKARRAIVVVVGILSVAVLRPDLAQAAPCQKAADCDDGNDCTQNLCINSACSFPERPAGTACGDDGNDCTRDLCGGSPRVCQHQPVSPGSFCADDGNECTNDRCQPDGGGSAFCAHSDVPMGSGCTDDGNECTFDMCGGNLNGHAFCQHQDLPMGSGCADDENSCTRDACGPSPSGFACVHYALPMGSACDDDHNDCTSDFCDAAGGGICRHYPQPIGSYCDDGSICTQSDFCDSAGKCMGTSPATDCRTAEKSLLTIKNSPRNSNDLVDYKWLKGDALEMSELGDPTATTKYTLCVFDGTGLLQMSAKVDGGSTCGDDPCWSSKPKGYAYSDKLRLHDGVGKILLKEGLAGKSAVQVNGKGVFLPDPIMPLADPVKVQVVNDETGVCVESSFSGGVSNEKLYKGKN